MKTRLLFRGLAVVLGAGVLSLGAGAASAPDGYRLDFPDFPPSVYTTNWLANPLPPGDTPALPLPPYQDGAIVAPTNVPTLGGGSVLISSTNKAAGSATNFYPVSRSTTIGGAAYMLVQSGFGYVVSGDKPDLYFGDSIAPPVLGDGESIDWATMAIWATNTLATTKSDGTTITNSIYGANTTSADVFFEPSIPSLYAASGGTFVLNWAVTNASSSGSGRVQTNIFTVASAPRQRPHRIFWTEPPYNAPTVNLIGRHVRFLWNEIIQAPVFTNTTITTTTTTTNGGSGATTGTQTTPGRTNLVKGLWVDNGQLKAAPGTPDEVANGQGLQGLVLMQYFTTGLEDQQVRSNGVIVVEVAAPEINVRDVGIGEELQPADDPYGRAGKTARVTQGLGASPYVYQHVGQFSHSPKNGAIFAVQDSSAAPWNIEVYWEETDLMGTKWPYEVDWYSATWNRTQLFVRDPSNGSASPAFLPASLGPKLWDYQDPPGLALAQLQTDGTFTVTLPPGVTNAYSLLQFSGKNTEGKDDTWFQAVRAVAYTNDIVYADTPGLDHDHAVPWPIGTEIQPVKARYALGFDGVGSAVAITNFVFPSSPPTRSPGFPVGGFRLGAWVRVAQPADGVTKPVLTAICTDCAGDGWSVSLAIAGDSSLSLSLRNGLSSGGSPATTITSTNRYVPDGAWQQVGLVVSGTNASILLGQDTVAYTRLAGLLGAPSTPTNGPILWLGTDRGTAGGTITNFFRGYVGEVAVEDTALGSKLTFPFDSLADIQGPSAADPNTLLVGGGITNGVVHGAQLTATEDKSGSRGPLDLTLLSADRDLIYDPQGRAPYNTNLYRAASPQNPNPESYVYGVNSGRLEVWWLQEVRPRGMPSNQVFFPRLPLVYTNLWPLDAPQIVLASGQGSPALAVNDPPRIYSQPNPTAPGYNPNEEHALIGQDRGGWVAYALRDDLGGALPEGKGYRYSAPFVLVDYVDALGVPGMKAFHVVRTNAAKPTFTYDVTVPGSVLGPHPLDLLSRTASTTSVAGPAWVDRQLGWWAVGAGSGYTWNDILHRTATIQMRPYYPMQADFWFPGASTQPRPGTPIPWLPTPLVASNPTSGTSITTLWTASWPTNAPVMQVGQTLTLPTTNGLPDVWDQKSVEIVHQQQNGTEAAASDGTSQQVPWGNSVKLFDPTVARTAPLANPLQLADHPFQTGPESLPGYVYDVQGRWYFRGLPPDLSGRLYWDPTTSRLTLVGALSNTDPAYLLVNALGASQRSSILNLNPGSESWTTAVNQLPATVDDLVPNQPFDHAALAAIGTGAGFVTVAFNNATNRLMGVQPGDPITLQVIQVTNTLYPGFVIPLEDTQNLVSEQMNILFSESFGGETDGFEFDWRVQVPNADGSAPVDPSTGLVYTAPPSAQPWSIQGLTRLLIGGDGATLKDLANQFFAVRYRATAPAVQSVVGTGYSEFTAYNLAEGWVQRVLNALTPFEQRMRDLSANPVETQGTMIQQAGAPYLGRVALNMSSVDQVGLIQLYSTVLDVAKDLSLANPAGAVNSPAVNQQLIIAANRLNVLYMVLGNEAYADALDPTIGFGSEPSLASGGLPSIDYGAMASSLFCFDNQVPSLLDEELALLRGRGNAGVGQATGMDTPPYFNRLFWNFTKGIDAGEVAYAVNYNTHQATNALITAATAAALYPQGHGDAWGHYLSALRGYLDLLTNPNFTWGAPMTDSLLLDPTADPFFVNATYRDERRIAETSAALIRSGVEIVRRAARKAYSAGAPGDSLAYPGSLDTDTNRAWGVVEWAGRAGSLSLYNWALCQSLLPPASGTNTTVENQQDSDRNSVRELDEMVAGYRTLQQEVDDVDQAVNPLGLATGAVQFDIDPTAVDAGQTHFEQIYQRALVALQNAAAAFDAAQDAGHLLRQQTESSLGFDEAMNDQESSYATQLVQLYGYPYAEDIGPAGAYPQGYNGPDLFHYMYVDLAEVGFDPTADIRPMITLSDLPVSAAVLAKGGSIPSLSVSNLLDYGSSTITNQSISLSLARNGLIAKPDWFGARRAEGQLQQAYRDYLGAILAFREGYSTWTNGMNSLVSQYAWYSQGSTDAPNKGWYDRNYDLYQQQNALADANIVLIAGKALGTALGSAGDVTRVLIDGAAETAMEGITKSDIVGGADGGDLFFTPRGAIRGAQAVIDSVIAMAQAQLETGLGIFQAGVDAREATLSKDLAQAAFEVADQELQTSILDLSRQQSVNLAALFPLLNQVSQARQRFLALQAQGEQLLAERARVRTAAANRMAMGRYNDMAFRIFRNDALRRYGDAFELAARYTHLAAKAYDYETCLLPSEKAYAPGALFLEQVVRARTVGRLDNGQPVVGSGVGDPGLADLLARMNGNWQVLKGRLGFNNPDRETSYFSLRQELFRIPTNSAYEGQWTRTLKATWVDDLRKEPVYRRYCLPFSAGEDAGGPEPGLVIRFPTTVEFGRNFFGKRLAGGDGAYDSSHFATKIRGVGVWFSNYDQVVESHPDAQLAREPRIYLVPVGLDKMRSPTGDGSTIRQWRVVDQVIPLPYPVGDDLDSRDWTPISDSLPGPWVQARRHPAMRAYQDRGFTPEELTYSSRLVGRSVWNDQWCLIIPAGTLGDDRIKALEAFVGDEEDPSGAVASGAKGISDIKLYFQTYSYHGN